MLVVLLPGLLVSILISIISQFLAIYIPNLGAALIAILLGMIVGNTILTHPRLYPGTQFSEKRLLEFAIVLNGLTLDFQMMKGIGFMGLLFVFLQMTFTIIVAILLGKLFKFTKVFSLLMAAGNAVCGTAAIGTVSPVLDANSKEKGMAITTVNVVGTVLMMILPVISLLLYNNETIASSALIGGVVQSVGQVVASAKLINDDVVNLATVFKLIRVLMIAVVAIVFGRLNLEEGKGLFSETKQKDNSQSAVKIKIPWFIIGFLLLFIIRSLNILPADAIVTTKSISTQFEVTALAAIGMRVNFKDIVKEGPKVMLYGSFIGVLQVVMAISLIAFLF